MTLSQVMLSNHLTSTARLIYWRIMALDDEGREATIAGLAHDFDLSERSIMRRLRELGDAGLIGVRAEAAVISRYFVRTSHA